MSRTTKDAVRQLSSLHRKAPYWAYRWWLHHGNKRSSAQIRRLRNRQARARARDCLVNEQEPWPEFRDIKYLYW